MVARLAPTLATVTSLAATGALAAAPAAYASDPYCTATYSNVTPKPAKTLRFGVDPGVAGSAGGVQLPSTPDDPSKDLQALETLRPPHKTLVLRLNRLFWSDGAPAIRSFARQAAAYARHGFDSEIQLRYHPAQGEAGDLKAWTRFVRQAVDAFGPDRHVVAMTVTNEVNVTFSPNTSDGYYQGAQDALIQGVEAAHQEAVRRHFRQLEFGFTYAYRFSPQGDAAFFTYLATHGGAAFRRALGFVGLDFYPGTIYPPAMAPTDSYATELAQAAGVLRNCFMPMAALTRRTPIWITETGISTGTNSEPAQAEALTQIVTAAREYARTFNITDLRWFNLRDATSSGPQTLVGPTFAAFGLLRDDYSRKPSFAAYRGLVAEWGTPSRSRRRTLRRRRGRKR